MVKRTNQRLTMPHVSGMTRFVLRENVRRTTERRARHAARNARASRVLNCRSSQHHKRSAIQLGRSIEPFEAVLAIRCAGLFGRPLYPVTDPDHKGVDHILTIRIVMLENNQRSA